MKDEEFDKLLKRQMQEDKYIPNSINQLFSDFEMEVKMKEEKSKSKIINFSNYLRTASIAASLMIVMLLGGSTYAHINGKETIISPLLRGIGINSKYEQNATPFDDEVVKNDVGIKIVNGAIDDTTLIVGYEINISNNNPSNWIEVNGEYKVNGMNIKPINSSVDKLSDTEYVYYQMFDVNEIKLDKNVKFNANIKEIKEYVECESLDSVEAIYGKTHRNNWSFEENIAIKNLNESKIYEDVNAKKYEVIKGVNISVNEFITGSYTNILKIHTDKTNYSGNAFEIFYKLKNENGKEISMFKEENKEYEYREYNDRIPLYNVNLNSKINVEVFISNIKNDKLNKVVTIPVDLSKMTQKQEGKSNIKKYSNDMYSFKYKDSWNLIEKVDTNRVGPKSIYLGALELEIPSTTNSKSTSSIYVRTIDRDTSLEQYIKQVREENTKSPSEYYTEKTSSDANFKNKKGYQITADITDGENIFIKQDIFTIANGKVYVITFFGGEIEYNNLKSDIDNFISNFELNM